jgi:hypothetical protein
MLNAHCQLIDACLLVCLFLVLENAWELTRRMYHRKKMIQVSEGDKLKREKFVESFKRTRPNHKNFKPKRESKLDDSESATSSNTATELDSVAGSGDHTMSEDDDIDITNTLAHTVTTASLSASTVSRLYICTTCIHSSIHRSDRLCPYLTVAASLCCAYRATITTIPATSLQRQQLFVHELIRRSGLL